MIIMKTVQQYKKKYKRTSKKKKSFQNSTTQKQWSSIFSNIIPAIILCIKIEKRTGR